MTAECYPIRLYGDPVLRRRAAPIRDIAATFTVPGYNGVGLPRLARNMLESMYEAHGVGLAAPQIGLPLRMFVAAGYSEDKQEGAESLRKSRVVRGYVRSIQLLKSWILSRKRVMKTVARRSPAFMKRV